MLNLSVLAGVALIVVAAFIAYFPSLNGGFIWDDFSLIVENLNIKTLSGLYQIWFSTETVDYWPVTYTTFWIEWRLWGMNATGYHVINLILHIIEALLIWVILRKLSLPGAFLAAMIFAVHPVNVESVAWIAQRKNLMAMLFFLLSILCYLRQFSLNCSDNAQRSRHSPCADPARGVRGLLIGRWYWLSLAAFVLAMLSKGSVAVLPLLLLGIVWWRRTGTVPIFAPAKMGLSPSVSRWDLLRTAPFFLVAVVLAGVNVWFQTHGAGNEIRIASFAQRLLGAGGVVWFYLYKALLPLSLVFVYPQWNIQADNPLWWLPLLAAVVVTAVLWRYRRGWSRPFLFAWGFFCVALVPVLGLTDVYFMKFSLVADHYQHLALLGVIALAAAGWGKWHQYVQGPARWAANTVAIVLLGALTLLSCQQSGLYRGEITLYQATLEKNPDSWMVQNNLGYALADAGRAQEAIKYYEQALRLKPNYPEALNNLGAALAKLDRPQEAIEHLEQALRLKPDYPEAHNNLGGVLANVDRLQPAIEHLEQVLWLKPDYPDAHNNLGIVLAKAGRLPEAIEHFQQALRLNSNSFGARSNLGNALVKTGRPLEAIEHYEQALRLKPDFLDAHYNLGIALFKVGRLHEAVEHFQQVLQKKPELANVYFDLALIYAKAQQSSEAVAAAQKALELARSKGQTALSKQIEDWLTSYRAACQNRDWG